MGDHDSSRTRVTPIFDALLARDPAGTTWLPTLISLPERAGARMPPTRTLRPITCWAWGAREHKLDPPRSLLCWLIRNVEPPRRGSHRDSGATEIRRQALLRRDPGVVAEALRLLSRPQLPSRAWYVLEGQSQPDVYLETPELLVVIEGKRTESGPTTDTTWMPVRHQMLRHLDGAWETRGNRKLVGFFIVEGAGGPDDMAVPQRWQIAAQETVAPSAIAGSLPHRSPEERHAIAAAFLGVTTWQRVCGAIGLSYAGLPDT